jgi:hypothetical protein
MRFAVPILLAALSILPASAVAASGKTQAVKAAPVKPAAKPPPAAPQGPFNSRDPASLTALLATMQAKAQVVRTTEDGVELTVATPTFSFGVQYVDCGPGKNACKALAFSTASETQRANLAQLNAFNQSSISCRAFQDAVGKPHVMYSTLLFAADTRETMRAHLGVWQGCLASFGGFLSDPNGYLATAP